VERIMECISIAEIRHCLKTLPEKLDDHYHQAWQRATGNGNLHRRKQAYYTLMWVTLAEQPLSLQALNEAVTISMNIDPHPESSTATSANDTLALWAGIVTIQRSSIAWHGICKQENAEPSSTKVLVVHASASEYFYARQDLYFPTSHLMITKTCAHVIGSVPIEPYWGKTPSSSLIVEA